MLALDARAGVSRERRPPDLSAEAGGVDLVDEGLHVRVAARELRRDRPPVALGDLPGTVTGAIGDADPRLALEDTLRTFQADEVITIPPPAAELNALKISPPDEVFKGVRLPVTVVQDSARPRTD